MEIKQEPLSLPSSSSSSSSSSSPFVQYHNQSNIKTEGKDSSIIATIVSDNKPQIHALNQYALQQKEQEFRIRKEGYGRYRMTQWEIDQEAAWDNYEQEQLIPYEKWLDLEIQWMENDYKEHLQQIQQIEELMEQKEQQRGMENFNQLEDKIQGEDMILQHLVGLIDNQSVSIKNDQ
ncbi:unnamed protein product [Adineta steineri]|uniref:Uncharacterized protein n=1 Tax=Adineta steineri TaxID=433720 RepID=A0A815RSR8_9BILA|nr:unnamed protein product [Adineta steineri]CAF1481650.1 unnamed protein product [Adineta steineri]CAF1618511.1 unnamed protein product [Adineta steineri]CAF1618552.1 unnamed protein product [Adineta steineri]